MALGKWIGGVLGFMTAGPLGALAGIVLGSLFDGALDSFADGNNDNQNNRQYSQSKRNYYEQYDQHNNVNQGQRNSFLFCILVLASYIIRSDGKVMHSEMEYVRNFLRQNFGSTAVSEGDRILRRLFEEQKRIEAQQIGSYQQVVMGCCAQMVQYLPYEQRLQLLAFLAQIAKSDGVVVKEEISAMYLIARALQLSDSEVDSMLNLAEGTTNLEAAYKVLEISPNASDDEVRKAYRKMALKHHPDKVSTLGEDIRKAAEKKFQEINAAKNLIYKARGLR